MKSKSNIFQVSQSKVQCWRDCRYKYYLRYVEGLRKKFKARPLRFGGFIHTMLDADFNGLNPFKALKQEVVGQGKLFAAEREEVEETEQTARIIMRDYFEYWEDAKPAQSFTPTERKGKNAEHEVLLDLTDGIKVIMKLDGLGVTGDKRRVLLENKTFKQLPSDDHRWRNLQSNIYKWGTDQLGIKLDGMMWNYIRSKVPSVPQTLKDGGVSKKRLDTLPAALKEHFGKEKIPEKLLADSTANRKNYFIRTFTAFRTQTVKSVFEDFVETAKEMRAGHGVAKAKTIGRHCEWCDMEPICRAELTGLDTKFIKKKEYTNREQREQAAVQSVD